MLRLSRAASWHAATRGEGSREVVLGSSGEALVRRRLHGERDKRTAAVGHVGLARLHEAAGADEIFTLDTPGLDRCPDHEPFDGLSRRILAATA